MPAVPSHSTAVDKDSSWDAGAVRRRVKEGQPRSYYNRIFAALDGDPKNKSAWKFPHHNVSADGTPGAANLSGVRAGLAVLGGARGGTDAGDKAGIRRHLLRHAKDGGMKVSSPAAAAAAQRALEAVAALRDRLSA